MGPGCGLERIGICANSVPLSPVPVPLYAAGIALSAVCACSCVRKQHRGYVRSTLRLALIVGTNFSDLKGPCQVLILAILIIKHY